MNLDWESEDVLLASEIPENLARLQPDHRFRTRKHVVRLFAVAREHAGRPQVEVELPEAATVADLRRKLAERAPELGPILDRVRIAVGDEYADDDAVIPPDAPLALIPPVSGG